MARTCASILAFGRPSSPSTRALAEPPGRSRSGCASSLRPTAMARHAQPMILVGSHDLPFMGLYGWTAAAMQPVPPVHLGPGQLCDRPGASYVLKEAQRYCPKGQVGPACLGVEGCPQQVSFVSHIVKRRTSARLLDGCLARVHRCAPINIFASMRPALLWRNSPPNRTYRRVGRRWRMGG